MGLRLETNSLEQNERKREGEREREREKGRECDSWIVVCGIALKSVVRECERQTAWNETAKKEAARFFSWKTGTRQSERERERPNLGIISGLARDKPGQRRPNEVKPRVNGALRFDSSFSTRNWLLPKITHNIVVTMIEYFYISVVFPICLSLSHPFLLLSSLVRKPFALRIFFSFFFFNVSQPRVSQPRVWINRSIDFFETRSRCSNSSEWKFYLSTVSSLTRVQSSLLSLFRWLSLKYSNLSRK